MSVNTLWAQPRRQEWLIQATDRHGAILGVLDGLSGGSLEWNANSTIRMAGRLEWHDTGQNIDWNTIRLLITYKAVTPDGDELIYPCGWYLPSLPSITYGAGGAHATIDIKDRTHILQSCCATTTLQTPAGVTAVDYVTELIESCGEENIMVEGTSGRYSEVTFDPQDTYLSIVNTLLDGAGYRALYCDGVGRLRVTPYTEPSRRPYAWEFTSGIEAIHATDFSVACDTFTVPNRITLVASTTGEEEPLTATLVLDDLEPLSPFGYAQRGFWIDRVDTGVDVTSLADLYAMAERRLLEGASPTRTLTLSHAPVPIYPGDVVSFRDSTGDMVEMRRGVVESMRLPLDGGLCETTVKEVANT